MPIYIILIVAAGIFAVLGLFIERPVAIKLVAVAVVLLSIALLIKKG
jgi:hypothetical protein